MANNGFDTAHFPERRGSRSVKWDTMATKYGREDLIPLWVADMDYPSPPCIQEALRKAVDFLFSITNLTKTAREFNENRRSRQKIMEQFSQRVYQNKTPYFSIRHRVLRLMPRRLAVWVWFMFSSS